MTFQGQKRHFRDFCIVVPESFRVFLGHSFFTWAASEPAFSVCASEGRMESSRAAWVLPKGERAKETSPYEKEWTLPNTNLLLWGPADAQETEKSAGFWFQVFNLFLPVIFNTNSYFSSRKHYYLKFPKKCNFSFFGLKINFSRKCHQKLLLKTLIK